LQQHAGRESTGNRRAPHLPPGAISALVSPGVLRENAASMSQDDHGAIRNGLIKTIGMAFAAGQQGAGSWRFQFDPQSAGSLQMIAEIADEPPLTLRSQLSAAELDGLIAWLGSVRQAMAAAPSAEPSSGAVTSAPGVPASAPGDTLTEMPSAEPTVEPMALPAEVRAAADTYNRARPYAPGLWTRIQQRLGVAGDGVPGPRTADGIAAFQATRGLPVDGRAAPRLLSDLGIGPIFAIDAAFFFCGRMVIDADGAPNAYNPQDTGIDFLRNAGQPGNWYGLAIDDKGEPLLQRDGDPHPGCYVSTTALCHAGFPAHDPRRYVDSTVIPYIALPRNIAELVPTPAPRKGDLAAVVHLSDPDDIVFALYADVSPRVTLDPEQPMGEGSIALARALGHDPFVNRNGILRAARSIPSGVFYVVFPGSGTGKPLSAADIAAQGTQAFKAWGGPAKLEEAIARVRAPLA
jgi:peptidoglycan hydrolase-like protein with peptidoglycan-binding domain